MDEERDSREEQERGREQEREPESWDEEEREFEDEDELPPSNLRGNLPLLLVLLAVVVIAFVLLRLRGEPEQAEQEQVPADQQPALGEKWGQSPGPAPGQMPPRRPRQGQPARPGAQPGVPPGQGPQQEPQRELSWEERRQFERAFALTLRAVPLGDKDQNLIVGRPGMQLPDGRVRPSLLFDVTKMAKGTDVADLLQARFLNGDPRWADYLSVLGADPKRPVKFLKADDVRFLREDDRVIGVRIGKFARAYPVRIMTVHWLMHDRIGETPVLVTWNPLTQAASCFVNEGEKEQMIWQFGGRVHLSNYVYYSKDGTLWDSFDGKALSGPRANVVLDPVPCTLTTWQHWRKQNPETLVLSRQTGFQDMAGGREIDYSRNQLIQDLGYLQTDNLLHTVPHFNPEDSPMPPKRWVFGLAAQGDAVAVPLELLEGARTAVPVTLAGKTVNVRFDAESETAWVEGERPEGLVTHKMLWFGWKARYPRTRVHGQREGEEKTPV